MAEPRKNAKGFPIVTPPAPYSPSGAAPGRDGEPIEEVHVRGVSDPETKARATAARNVNHRVIFRLHHRGQLNENGDGGKAIGDLRLRAAEKLYDDHYLAGLEAFPSTLAALAAGGGGGGDSAAEIWQMKIDASRRLAVALGIVGTLGRFVLEQVVLQNRNCGDVAKLLRRKENTVLPILQSALDTLRAHYGFDIAARARIRGGEATPIHPFQDGSGVRG